MTRAEQRGPDVLRILADGPKTTSEVAAELDGRAGPAWNALVWLRDQRLVESEYGERRAIVWSLAQPFKPSRRLTSIDDDLDD